MLWPEHFYKICGTIKIPQTFQVSHNLWMQYRILIAGRVDDSLGKQMFFRLWKTCRSLPIPYHSDQRKVDYQNPNGIASFATCKCGSTLAITSQGMDPFTFWRLMFWAIKECRVRKIFLNELLSQIRRQIDRDVIEEDKKGKANSPEVI